MIEIDIPGSQAIAIEHVVAAYDGTLATDGLLHSDAAMIIRRIAKLAHVVILTTDVHGKAEEQCREMGVEVVVVPDGDSSQAKADYVKGLSGQVACVGNGRNDIGMFEHAAFAVAVMDTEGVSTALMQHADIIARNSEEALALLVQPNRVRATLRS